MIKKDEDVQVNNELNRLRNQISKKINFQNQEGVTILMFAVYKGFFFIFIKLLYYAINLQIKEI